MTGDRCISCESKIVDASGFPTVCDECISTAYDGEKSSFTKLAFFRFNKLESAVMLSAMILILLGIIAEAIR